MEFDFERDAVVMYMLANDTAVMQAAMLPGWCTTSVGVTFVDREHPEVRMLIPWGRVRGVLQAVSSDG